MTTSTPAAVQIHAIPTTTAAAGGVGAVRPVVPAPRPAPSAVAFITSATIVASLLVVAVGWTVMWWASSRLAPDPIGDAARAAAAARQQLMAELEAGGAAGAVIDVSIASRGRDIYAASCVACHGQDGSGQPGLGKDLVRSKFIRSMSDEELIQMIAVGRPANHPLNTTKVPMPPDGGVAGMTEVDREAVAQYLRGLQDPRRMPELPAHVPVAAAPPTESEKSVALAAAGGDAELAEYIASGTKLYASSCVACHGAGGAGIAGNGKPLAGSEFVRSLDDDGLLAFVQRGRDPSDPKNTTGIAMPPKGGNPALSEDDILDIIAYLRTLPGNQGDPAQK